MTGFGANSESRHTRPKTPVNIDSLIRMNWALPVRKLVAKPTMMNASETNPMMSARRVRTRLQITARAGNTPDKIRAATSGTPWPVSTV